MGRGSNPSLIHSGRFQYVPEQVLVERQVPQGRETAELPRRLRSGAFADRDWAYIMPELNDGKCGRGRA
jgi:hypothetical protein